MPEAEQGRAPADALAGRGRPSRPVSLRLRMAAIASLVLLVALGLVGFALASAQQRSAVAALRQQMESYVHILLAAIDADAQGELRIGPDLGDPRLQRPGSGVYIHVHGAHDHWTSPSALGLRLPELSEVPTGTSSFAEPRAGVRFYTYQLGVAWQFRGRKVVPFTASVLVDARELRRSTAAFRLGLWQALGGAGIILLLAQWLLIFLAFRPLRQVATDVARVESGQARSVPVEAYPRELEPLARNLNRLLATEKANQQNIRNALDSLAHSLKTPLAVLRAGLEAGSPATPESLGRAVDEMHHLITTRLQRAAAAARSTLSQPVDVAAEAARILSGLEKVYSHKTIRADVSMPQGLKFYGERRDLLEMLGNLLDNAFKYGRSRIELQAGPLDAERSRPGIWIRVGDDGRGIDPEMWPALLQRGVRGDERVEGHGLGLAILLELVTAYGGNMEIGHSELGGAQIRVLLPGS